MKNYALSPLIEDFTMMTSSKSKINVISLVENCLSYNISKSGRKSITDKRDNLNWTKTKMTSSKKYIFVSLDANMMTLFHFLRVRVVWNHISNPCSFQPLYKNWGWTDVLKSYFDFKNGMFWPIFALYCPWQHARILNFDALARPYERSRVTANEWKLSIVVSEIQIM